MTELGLANCVQCTLDDRDHSMHVEDGQYHWQLEGPQSSSREKDELMILTSGNSSQTVCG